jgi:hypothetical protein
MPSITASPPALFGRSLRRALLAVAIGALAVMLLYLAFNVPGRWFPSAEPLTIDPGRLAVSRGRAQAIPGALVVTSPSVNEAAVVVVSTELKSEDYAAIEWSVSGLPDIADVRLLWRNSYRPDRLNVAQMIVDGGRLRPIVIASDPNWVGTIRGLGIAIGSTPPEGIAIRSVTARPLGALELAGLRVSEWFAFEGWRAHSVESIAGGSDAQDLPLPVVLVAAIALVTTSLALLAWRRREGDVASIGSTIVMLFVAAWLIADARWAFNLARQSLVTLRTYAGLSYEEAHLAAEDGALYRLVQQAREKLPESPARVFVLAEAPYFRARAAYYLVPHNAWFDLVRTGFPEASLLRPGDWVMAYRRRGVQFNQAAGRLRWDGGNDVPAELALVTQDGALFRVTGAP